MRPVPPRPKFQLTFAEQHVVRQAEREGSISAFVRRGDDDEDEGEALLDMYRCMARDGLLMLSSERGYRDWPIGLTVVFETTPAAVALVQWEERHEAQLFNKLLGMVRRTNMRNLVKRWRRMRVKQLSPLPEDRSRRVSPRRAAARSAQPLASVSKRLRR